MLVWLVNVCLHKIAKPRVDHLKGAHLSRPAKIN
jgi:hypothetical protein